MGIDSIIWFSVLDICTALSENVISDTFPYTTEEALVQAVLIFGSDIWLVTPTLSGDWVVSNTWWPVG